MAELERPTAQGLVAWSDLLQVATFGALILLVTFVAVYSPYLGLVALGLLLAGLVLGGNLKWGILALVFFLPFDPQIELKPGLYIYFDLLFILPAFVYLWKVIFDSIRIHWSSFLIAPYVLFAIVSTVWRAEDLFWFSAYSARLIVAVLFIVVIAAVGQAETITCVLAATLVPQVVYGAYQVIENGPGPLYLLFYPHYESQVWTDRARGFFFAENNFGGYCAIVMVMALALAVRTQRTAASWFCYIAAGVGLVGLAISGSRGAGIAAFAGLMVMFIYSRTNWRTKLAVVVLAVIAVVVAQSLSVAYAPLERVQTIDTFTVESRTSMYLAALLLFARHPLIGAGLTNYQTLMSSVVNWNFGPENAAHNTYLHILSENGLLGFLLFFGPVIYLFRRNLRKARQSLPALLSSAGLAVFLVHGLFDFQLMTAPQYLLLFAILVGIASKASSDSASVAPRNS